MQLHLKSPNIGDFSTQISATQSSNYFLVSKLSYGMQWNLNNDEKYNEESRCCRSES